MAAAPSPRRVLGRILKRVPLQLYPDTFLAEPEIAPTAGGGYGGLRLADQRTV